MEGNKVGRQYWDHRETATLNMITGGLTEMTLELHPKGVLWASGDMFQAEGMANAKALRWEYFWHVQGPSRPV